MKVQCYECGCMCHCDLDPESVPDSWTCEECLDDFFFRDSQLAGTSCFAFVIADDEPHVAFSNKHHAYHMFGGKLDGDESPDACIKRELTEELGLTDFSTLSSLRSSVIFHEGSFYRHHYFSVSVKGSLVSREPHLTPVSLTSALRGRHYRAGFTAALTDALEVANAEF